MKETDVERAFGDIEHAFRAEDRISRALDFSDDYEKDEIKNKVSSDMVNNN